MFICQSVLGKYVFFAWSPSWAPHPHDPLNLLSDVI